MSLKGLEFPMLMNLVNNHLHWQQKLEFYLQATKGGGMNGTVIITGKGCEWLADACS